MFSSIPIFFSDKYLIPKASYQHSRYRCNKTIHTQENWQAKQLSTDDILQRNNRYYFPKPFASALKFIILCLRIRLLITKNIKKYFPPTPVPFKKKYSFLKKI